MKLRADPKDIKSVGHMLALLASDHIGESQSAFEQIKRKLNTDKSSGGVLKSTFLQLHDGLEILEDKIKDRERTISALDQAVAKRDEILSVKKTEIKELQNQIKKDKKETDKKLTNVRFLLFLSFTGFLFLITFFIIAICLKQTQLNYWQQQASIAQSKWNNAEKTFAQSQITAKDQIDSVNRQLKIAEHQSEVVENKLAELQIKESVSGIISAQITDTSLLTNTQVESKFSADNLTSKEFNLNLDNKTDTNNVHSSVVSNIAVPDKLKQNFIDKDKESDKDKHDESNLWNQFPGGWMDLRWGMNSNQIQTAFYSADWQNGQLEIDQQACKILAGTQPILSTVGRGLGQTEKDRQNLQITFCANNDKLLVGVAITLIEIPTSKQENTRLAIRYLIEREQGSADQYENLQQSNGFVQFWLWKKGLNTIKLVQRTNPDQTITVISSSKYNTKLSD